MATLYEPEAAPSQDRALAECVATHAPAFAALRAAVGDAMWGEAIRAWSVTSRPSQREPKGEWQLWLLCAGRGFGKTRAGAEWVDTIARENPGARIALIGASHDDVRKVMIEGESGIMNLCGLRQRPVYNPALRRLIWPAGAMATCYSAAEPEALRGPQHHFAWADEVARWGASVGDEGRRGIAAWDNLMLGLRLGAAPRVLATTTPRAVPLVRALMQTKGAVITGGPTHANATNLPPSFLAAIEANYGGTRLGRQEIGGELIEDIEGALWTRDMLERCRASGDGLEDGDITRIVIGVDPPASQRGDACGIVVAARLNDRRLAVLADASVEQATPERWAAAVAEAARKWRADRVVAEANNGGEMVASVLRSVEPDLPVVLVHASRGKSARAEPVSIAYAQERIIHIGSMARLEDQLCGMLSGGGYAGPGRSPDRADALVWACHALMIGNEPRVRGL